MPKTATTKPAIIRWGFSRLGPNNKTYKLGDLTVVFSWKQGRNLSGPAYITTHQKISDADGNTLVLDGDDQMQVRLYAAGRNWWTADPDTYLRAAFLGAFTGSTVYTWADDDALWAAGQLGITLGQYRDASNQDRAAWVMVAALQDA